MKVFTWNVLHRVHGEGHGEEAVVQWSDEARRVREVVARVRSLLEDEGCSVALLQEVSGDVLTALRSALSEWAVLNHVYPRVPRPKQGSTSVRDSTEHLVVVAPAGAKVVRASTAVNDAGKGLLAVRSGEVTVVSTHVSWGERGVDQLSALRVAMESLPEPVVVGGDFNVEVAVVERALGVVAAKVAAGSLHTREAGGKGADIDHLLARGVLGVAQVLEHSGLSDHRPVVVSLCPSPRAQHAMPSALVRPR